MKKKMLIMLIMTMFGSFLCVNYASGTFSRYVSSSSSEPTVNVAVPIFNTSIESLLVPLDEMYPGQTKTYNFSVSNYSGNKRSDVTLDYVINIERSTNMPVTVELYKNGINTNVLTNYASPTYTMSHGTDALDNYQLVINWPSQYDDEVYANLTEYMQIVISANQKVN